MIARQIIGLMFSKFAVTSIQMIARTKWSPMALVLWKVTYSSKIIKLDALIFKAPASQLSMAATIHKISLSNFKERSDIAGRNRCTKA